MPVASNQAPYFLMACCRGTWVKTHLAWLETLPTHVSFVSLKKVESNNGNKRPLHAGYTVPLKSKLTLVPRNSRLDPRVLKLQCFEFRDARIESQVSMIKEAWFSERTMLYSHVAVEIFALSISACRVL